MLKRPPIGVLTAVLLMLSLLRVAIAEKATDYPRRPKLVLTLVIDQFRYDYLVRFRPQFVEGGFNLLLNGGANFADCRYDYATTATGPGHATLLTGAHANVHDYIGHAFGPYSPQVADVTLRTDRFVVLDPYAAPVSGSRETTHGSPWNYDSQVPLLLWGSAFKPGVYFSQCQPIDLAATLAATLGLTQPSGSQGSPLVPAIKQ